MDSTAFPGGASPYSPPQKLNAAQAQGARNRLTIAPHLVQRIAVLCGYDDFDAFDEKLQNVIELTDLLELLLTIQLVEVELQPTVTHQLEAERARKIVNHIVQGKTVSRKTIHDALPAETVVLFKMGPPHLWNYAARQRIPHDAMQLVPKNLTPGLCGPYTTPEEAWLGWHITNAEDLQDLETQVADIPYHEDRFQRLRLGMSLADGPDQVWSAARGHWSIKPETRYIAPSRYGWCPYVYRIADDAWRADPFEGHRPRYMAEQGWWIDVEHERLVTMGAPDPNNAWMPQMSVSDQEPSAADLQVARALTGKVLQLGATGKNPVIRLRQRGRKLL